MWLLSLFQEMNFTLPQPPLLLCENLGGTQLSFNPVQHSRMKHIQINIHFVRDLVEIFFLMFGMFTLMTNSPIYSPSHFPDKGQTIYRTRSDYPMVACSCGGVSRKLIISNKCQLKSSCHHEHYQILCLPIFVNIAFNCDCKFTFPLHIFECLKLGLSGCIKI